MNRYSAYLLAEAGYDVFLGNARGSEPSREHTHLDPNGRDQEKYWSFSWHEMGFFDLPASIDYILNLTKFDKLNYIGFSQGTISFFVMASLRPEYNDKIIEANLMAPVANLKGIRNPYYNAFTNSYKAIKLYAKVKRLHKVILDNEKLMKIADLACKDVVDTTPKKCQLVLSTLNSNQINCVGLSLVV